ncbi:MAG: peptide-methionine (S)-S-oxide reductase MsrA [Chloroflexi bacterium]|nr:peptide-methionine (S)-S-oxide reductase MsrA [Chloroflexota bacterium]
MNANEHGQAGATGRSETATLAGGCFWCLEAVFEQVRGVQQVVSGFSGGHVQNPTYEQVCTGQTGHAESVQLTFDPAIVSFTDILNIFFSIHDPTTLDRQGPDVGPHYRSAIFYHTMDQKEAAEKEIADLTREGTWPGAIVTEVTSMEAFYPAEEYHQQYYRRNSGLPYCQIVISPKVAKFRKEHLAALEA